MKRSDKRVFVSCPGSRVHKHYESRFNGSKVEIVETGETDIQKEIEAYGKYTDLHYMLHRLSVGDTSVLSAKTPIYGDFSGLPTNPIDAINIVNSAESAFGKLSMDERSRYHNDYRAWLAAVLSGDVVSNHSVQTDSADTAPLKED